MTMGILSALALAVTLAGSSTVAPIANELIRAKIIDGTVQVSDSGAGLRCLKENKCDIALVSRPPKPDESKTFDFVLAGYVPLSVLVHPSSTKRKFTILELQSVFGGKNKAYSVYARETGSGSRAVFESTIKAAPTEFVANSTEEMIIAISGHSDAIGYANRSQAELQKKAVAVVDITGAPATASAIRSGKYPFIQPIYFVFSASNPSRAAVEKNLKSPAARMVLTRLGVVIP